MCLLISRVQDSCPLNLTVTQINPEQTLARAHLLHCRFSNPFDKGCFPFPKKISLSYYDLLNVDINIYFSV